jgi:putative DNA methylase
MRDNPLQPRGWHERGYLPHFDAGETPQAITFRLWDSLPADVLARIDQDLAKYPNVERVQRTRRRRDAALDAGHGAAYLATPNAARAVERQLLYFTPERYSLHAWVIVPNHVHVLFTPREEWALGAIVKSWKYHAALEINRLRGTSGTVWAPDYVDRFSRDAAHFERTVAYIENNPVKAGLCGAAADWPWSSARSRAIGDDEMH